MNHNEMVSTDANPDARISRNDIVRFTFWK